MQTDHLISADQFCNQHHIELSFINFLYDNGLIEITIIQETRFIPIESIVTLEKCVRLHYELDINIEGIEAITHLLRRIDQQQNEITALRNRLRLYENVT